PLRLRRRQHSTLVPYTTLFRSEAAEQLRRGPPRPLPSLAAVAQGQRRVVERRVPGQQLVALGHVGAGGQTLGGTVVSADRDRARDRKSTRLNSSHVKISYAVFC